MFFFEGERGYRIANYLTACSEKPSVKVHNLPYYIWNTQLKRGIKIVAWRKMWKRKML